MILVRLEGLKLRLIDYKKFGEKKFFTSKTTVNRKSTG